MKAFFEPLMEIDAVAAARRDLQAGNFPVCIEGCIDAQKSHLAAGLSQGYQYKLIVAEHEQKARQLYEDYKFFDRQVCMYPAKDVLFYQSAVHGNLLVRQRLQVICRLLGGGPLTVITTVDALMEKMVLPAVLKEAIRILKPGMRIFTESFTQDMVSMGYERVGQVEVPGQFAVRGGIIDIYNMTDDCPARIELWGDEIDSMRTFDAQSQRSIANIDQLCIYPASEMVVTPQQRSRGLSRLRTQAQKAAGRLKAQKEEEAADRLKEGIRELTESIEQTSALVNMDNLLLYFYDETGSLLDYFPAGESLCFLDEAPRLAQAAEAVELEFRESMADRLRKGYLLAGQADVLYSTAEVFTRMAAAPTVMVGTFSQKVHGLIPRAHYGLRVKSIQPYNGDFSLLVQDLKHWAQGHCRVILVCRSDMRARQLSRDLQEEGLTAFHTQDMNRVVQNGEIMLIHGSLRHGMEYPLIGFVLLAESDIFGAAEKKKRLSKKRSAQSVTAFTELIIGDYVVHENHGIGIYRGIENIEVDGIAKDYMKIEYAEHGNLYIPATQLDVIQKYSGGEGAHPALSRLGGSDWSRTKTRVKKAVQEVAADLVRLYAARASKSGYAFGADTVWQQEFEELFPYEETQCQKDAIADTKRDMESTRIMDRLICGDVGYGKTEVAIRAAFKAVQDGKQVVMLVPTTILAQQHYQTFSQRMKDYPITVDLLCRFRTAREQKQTLHELARGMVDIVIGTHRVLSNDVQFKDLGLLIVDEEQRFGVAHKEKIKKLKEEVDVLTLSATPIPRTLHMSMIGIRDMSLLDEPPADRMPVQTYVLEYDEELIREAIHRELSRNGQVYYVYNRVNGIADMTARIRGLAADANVAYAHGQMNERELERIMYDFMNGAIDVLVSTTIIENGLDIANVNTIIIHDADRLGLSQLYQLRGRVGRSGRTAYAFFMYRRDKVLKEEAQKRLSAIREFSELGSGFRISMRDLEIRGAGSLLGERQSGHMQTVGYDLYCRMLGEAVKELTGRTMEESFETTIDLPLGAYIPPSYISSEEQKLAIYKRIAAIMNEEEYEEMADELMDRFGEMPRPVINLLDIALLKAQAHAAGISSLVHHGTQTEIEMYPLAQPDGSRIVRLVEKYRGAMKFSMMPSPHFTVKTKSGPGFDLLKCERILIDDIKKLTDVQEAVQEET